MNIINNTPVYKINYPNKMLPKRNIFSASGDVFVKSTSFKGTNEPAKDMQSYEEFNKWAKETDFVSKVQDVADRTGRILGSGFEGTTFEIPETDKWVLKQYKRANFIQVSREKPDISEIRDISPELNIGQTIAKIEIPTQNKRFCYVYYILKRQSGNSIGVPYAYADEIDRDNINRHLSSLQKLAALPQSSFDKCVRDVDYVTKQGYEIDCSNPYNFMLDEGKQEIHFVDINDKLRDKTTQHGEVLYALLDGPFGTLYRESDSVDKEEQEKAAKLSDTIIQKYITAMKKCDAQFSSGRYFDGIQSYIDKSQKQHT